jgi:hypothetical protein
LDNLVWLRGQATTARGSISETLDRLVTEARAAGKTQPGTIRSVVGTIDIADEDPLLEQADEVVRGQFDASLRRPLLVREPAARFRARRAGVKGPRRG